MRSRRAAWPWLLGIGAAVLPALWAVNQRVPMPSTLGLTGGRLNACPDSPNCVCSEGGDASHAIAPFPFPFTDEAGVALSRVRQALDGMPGARRVREETGYLHYEFRTPVCRFVDDLEVAVDEGARLVHVRSASRVGYSDMGANRKRVEELRRRLAP